MAGDISGVMGGESFNPQEHEAQGDFEPLPPGWYSVEVDSAEVKQTRNGDGYYLKIQFNVIGESYNGRKLFDQINLSNPNQKAEEIGQRELASLGQAVGLTAINDSAELQGKTLEVKTKVEDSQQFGENNKITSYRACGSGQRGKTPASAPASQPTQGQQQAEPATAGTGQQDNGGQSKKPPWQK